MGRSVKLYLVDGTATGILTAEIMNWTGHVLAAPRTRIEDVLTRDELKRTGVYLLIGPDDQGTELLRVYVGEGDEIGKRLYSHNKDKDFWERFVAVTSKDMNLTKAHVRYLEGRLLAILSEAKKAVVDNKDMPQFDLLPEADISDMETFLREIQLVLPVIGVEFLRRPKVRSYRSAVDSRGDPTGVEATTSNSPSSSDEVIFFLENKNASINATAREEEGEFIVLSGSVGSLKEKRSLNERNKIARDQAFETGRARKINDKNFVLDQDISFTSPSAASVFLFGTSRNGRTDWIVQSVGKSYGVWKDDKIKSKTV